MQHLSNDQLRHYVPSVFTSQGSAETSDRYTHISTIEIIEGLRGQGFMPVKAMQCNVRNRSNIHFAKHMLRFRHVDAIANNDGLFQEMVLVNSHDGKSAYKLMAGLYRMICSNGLIAGDTFASVKVRHQGDILGNVIEGTFSVMDQGRKMLEHSDAMSGIILNQDEKRIFSEAVHQIRFDGQSVEKTGIKPDQFLRARRYQEQGKDDLFTVFNIAQENSIKGGLRGYAVDENGRYRDRTTGNRLKLVTTREVKAIDTSNNLNRALWTLAEKMRELKS